MKVTKKAYVKLVETLAMNGYDISNMLNPTYKNIDSQKCLDLANQIFRDHNRMVNETEEDFWKYNDKLTLENI